MYYANTDKKMQFSKGIGLNVFILFLQNIT